MKITFDPVKQAANIQKHGLDFADLDTDFFFTIYGDRSQK
jgi:uncharacterized DUF497 family protein